MVNNAFKKKHGKVSKQYATVRYGNFILMPNVLAYKFFDETHVWGLIRSPDCIIFLFYLVHVTRFAKINRIAWNKQLQYGQKSAMTDKFKSLHNKNLPV